jgi:hypothetical protein
MKQTNIKKIVGYNKLKPNWNGYGGDPIPSDTINIAIQYIKAIDKQPTVSPTGRGSIQFDLTLGDNNITFEIFSYEIQFTDFFSGEIVSEGTIPILQFVDFYNELCQFYESE